MIWQDEVDYRLVQHISKMNDVIRMQRKPCAARQKIPHWEDPTFTEKQKTAGCHCCLWTIMWEKKKHWVMSKSSMPVHAAPSLPCNMVHWALASMSPVSASCNTICDYSVPKRVHSARRNQKQQIDILLHGGPAAPTMKLTSRRWRWTFSGKCWQWNFSEKEKTSERTENADLLKKC